MKKISFLLLILSVSIFASAQDVDIKRADEVMLQDTLKEKESRLYGPFSINNQGDKVYFSQGDLQYQASTNTWRFAEHQWDFVGDDTDGNVYENDVKCNNALTSDSYDGWIDLFGWGTGQNPTHTGCYYDDIPFYKDFHEWGDNKISNGANRSWRTLTNDEWYYITMRNRNNKAIKVSYVIVEMEGFSGMALLPDTWNNELYPLVNNTSYTISKSDWIRYFESQGAVFLPVSYSRECDKVYKPRDKGSWGAKYWSSSQRDDSFGLQNNGSQLQKFFGLPVRLVTNAY